MKQNIIDHENECHLAVLNDMLQNCIVDASNMLMSCLTTIIHNGLLYIYICIFISLTGLLYVLILEGWCLQSSYAVG